LNKAVRDGVELAVKIYVGNLSYRAADEDLQKAFEPYGTVASAQVMMERGTGRSRGFGFVDMPNADEANAAIAALNGKEILGRPVRANEAKPLAPR
jgi:RNA recognition motif-containing protein